MSIHAPDLQTMIRRHLHDVRNHLNSIEIDVALIETSTSDPQMLGSINRIRAEVSAAERAMRALSIRFKEPTRGVVAAIDVFHLWRSRSRAGVSDAAIEWECGIEREMINVDLRMTADALCELLRNSGAAPTKASGVVRDGGVSFEIQLFPAGSVNGSLLPGIEAVIASNGGTYQRRETTEDGGTVACRFPLVT